MTDIEFDILDQLYFVVSYHDLLKSLSYEEEQVLNKLKSMQGKGWLKVFREMDQELEENEVDLDNNYKEYYFLASKKGLFAHNSR